MDETRRFAMASPATTKEINTPRVGTEQRTVSGPQGMGGWRSFLLGAAELTAQVSNLKFPPLKRDAENIEGANVDTDADTNDARIESLPSNSEVCRPDVENGEGTNVETDADTDTNEAQIESHPSKSAVEQTAEGANEETHVDNSEDQVLINENLDTVSDEEYLGDIICQTGVDEQQQKMESLARELEAQLNAAKQAKALYKSEIKAAKRPSVAPVKTLSTEPSTEASLAKRVSSTTSEGEGGIAVLGQKKDFELSPDSFFVKYGMECKDKKVRGHVRVNEKENETRQIKLPMLTPRTRSKAVLKNASILSEVVRDKHYDTIASKPSGTLDMIKKIMVWDISSDEEEEESVTQGRLYNDTFEDDLSSKYSTSFESNHTEVRDSRMGQHTIHEEEQYEIEEKSSIESEGSISCQTSYSRSTGVSGVLSYQTTYTERSTESDGSSYDSESQSYYTTDGSYDSLSPSSSKFGRKGFPLM